MNETMNIGNIFDIKSNDGNYLLYLIGEYSKLIITPYLSLFSNREGKLEVLLNDDFNKAKDSIDLEIKRISNYVNTFDKDNLNENDLNELAKMIDILSNYIKYVIEQSSDVSMPQNQEF